MANDKNFVIKNGLQAGRYLQTGGTETAVSEGYGLGSASYDGVSVNIATTTNQYQDITFNNDGTKLFTADGISDIIREYSLSTAFDLTTLTYVALFDVTSQESSLSSIAFNNDGTKMYVVGTDQDTVFQYSLSTAFSVSTASYDSVSFSIASEATLPRCVRFNNDGTKMYIANAINGILYQYTLSTPFDLSTASYNSINFDASAQDINASKVAFNSDGTKMYILGSATDNVYQYSLSTAFDVGTASYDNIGFSVASQDTSPFGLAFNSDGTKMYMLGYVTDTIYQYSTVQNTQILDLTTGTYFSFTPSGATTVSFTNAPASGKAVGFAVEINGDGSAITWPTSVKWHEGTAPTATASKEVYAFVTTDGGTTYYGKQAAEGVA